MISKYSVKRPYTVLVVVVAIIVIGVVALTKMTMDLLPDMELPYVVVVVTDMGASPEEVESDVTAPVEAALASTTNLKEMESSSYNSYSMIMLEFEQTTNMDSIMIEISSALDQIEGTLPSSTGSPIVMQINPDMLPVMVAAVDVEGMDSIKLTDYTESEIVPDLESVEGVASVTMLGGVEEKVIVTLDDDKIAALNDKIQSEIEGQFDDAYASITDAEEEIEDSETQLESGKDAFASTIGQNSAKLSQTESELYEKQAELESTRTQLLTTHDTLATVSELLASVYNSVQTMQSSATSLSSVLSLYANGTLSAEQFKEAAGMSVSDAASSLGTLSAALAAYGDDVSGYTEVLSQVSDRMAADAAEGVVASITDAAGSSSAGGSATDISKILSSTDAESLSSTLSDALRIAAAGQSISYINDILPDDMSISSYLDIPGLLGTITEKQTEIITGINTIDAALSQINDGKLTVNQAMQMLESETIKNTIKMSEASAQLTLGKASLEQAREQIDSAKESALKQADLTGVLSMDVINNLLLAQNIEMPVGYVSEDGDQYIVKVGENVSDIDALRELVLIDIGMDSVGVITLGDIADVEMVDNSSEVYAKVNGSTAILLSMEKQTGYSTGDVSDSIQEKFETIESTYAEDVGFSILMDQGVYIDIIAQSILENVIVGAALAMLVLIVFLRDFRPTLIIACAIPISLIFAIVLMYFTGIKLNIISMSGLTLGIGMLVDNSIVVIENIYRLYRNGESIKKSAVYGASQVAGAITGSTLTTIGVFLPIVFTEGLTRQLFVDMGLTIAYTLTASLVVALTVVPAMAQGVLKNSKANMGSTEGAFMRWYGRVIAVCMRFKPVVFIVMAALLGLSFTLSYSRGTEFIPDMTSQQITVTLSQPTDEEKTFAQMSGYSDTLMDRLTEIEEVETVGAMIGSSSTLGALNSSSGNSVTMYVLLDEDSSLSNEESEAMIQDAASDLDCRVTVDTSMLDMSMLTGSGISVMVKGKELDTLEELATEVAELIGKVEGIKRVKDGMSDMTPEFIISVDKEKAAGYGLTAAQVMSAVAESLASDTVSTTLVTESKDYDVYVQTGEQSEVTLSDIEAMTVSYTDTETGETEEVKLSEIAEFSREETLTTISRNNQTKYIQVSASVESDYNTGLVGKAVQRKLDTLDVPEGYSVSITGENEATDEAIEQVLLMLLLAVILIYLIMVAQFQSLLSPFIIMFTIPLAFTGGFALLYISGRPISVIALIGFVMLSGIIVNNGIVLVDYIIQLRRQGMPKREAIIESSKTRLRPVLMTALTTIISMSTMALGMGSGTELSQPMAIVVVGGMIYGTLLTLIVIPCLYDAFNREKDMTEEEI